MADNAKLIFITGIMAAGKSTVAQQLAERLPRSVHLRGDLFRRMIVNGRAEMGVTLSEAALAQLRLRYRLAALVAGEYLAAGFSVVVQDIVIGQGLTEVLPLYAESCAGFPQYLVVLCPSPVAVAAREAGRNKRGYDDPDWIEEFDQILRSETPPLGFWIDSSDLTVAETVDRILANLARARLGQAALAETKSGRA